MHSLAVEGNAHCINPGGKQPAIQQPINTKRVVLGNSNGYRVAHAEFMAVGVYLIFCTADRHTSNIGIAFDIPKAVEHSKEPTRIGIDNMFPRLDSQASITVASCGWIETGSNTLPVKCHQWDMVGGSNDIDVMI